MSHVPFWATPSNTPEAGKEIKQFKYTAEKDRPRKIRCCSWTCLGLTTAVLLIVFTIMTSGHPFEVLGAAATMATTEAPHVTIGKPKRAHPLNERQLQVLLKSEDPAVIKMNKDAQIKQVLSSMSGEVSQEAKEFSEKFNNQDENWADYVGHRTKCFANFKERKFSSRDFFTYKYYPDTHSYEHQSPKGRNSWCQAKAFTDERGDNQNLHKKSFDHFKVHECSTPATHEGAEEDETWEMVRFGPFKSYGGYDWHSIWSYDAATAISKHLKKHHKMWMTGYFAGVVDEDGNPMDYPPIHHHHLHVAPTTWGQRFPNHDIMIQLHGDHSLRQKDGGVKTFLSYFPKDYAYPIAHPFQLDTDLNDVRAENSPEMTFYLDLSFRVTSKPPLYPAALLNFGGPFPVRLDENRDAPPLRRWSEHAVYWVPADKPSVMWYSGELYKTGRALHTITHSHAHFFQSFYIFSGTPQELGLNKAPYEANNLLVEPFLPEEHGITLEDMKLKILYESQTGLAKLRCVSDGILERVNLTQQEIKMGYKPEDVYDRQPDTTCFGDWSFEKGQPFTIVAFNKPMCDGCAEVKGPYGGRVGIPQHTIFRAVYVNDEEPEDVKHFFTYGSQQGDAFVHATYPDDPHANTDPHTNLVLAFQSAVLSGARRFPPPPASEAALTTLDRDVKGFSSIRRNAILDEFCTD